MKIVIFSIITFLVSCTPKNTMLQVSKNEYLKGKMIRLSCASAVIQIIDDKQNIGEEWTEMGTERKISNAVNVLNKCELPASLKAGDEFYFKIINESEAKQNCIACMMMDYPPQKRIYIKVK